jgi:hypothetical protein
MGHILFAVLAMGLSLGWSALKVFAWEDGEGGLAMVILGVEALYVGWGIYRVLVWAASNL